MALLALPRRIANGSAIAGVVTMVIAASVYTLGHRTAAIALSLVAVMLAGFGWFIGDRLHVRPRRDCLRRLSARPDSNFSQEVASLAARRQVPKEDVERLWIGVCRFWGIDHKKIRVGDWLRTDLGALISSPRRDLFLSQVVRSGAPVLGEPFHETSDWGDLLTWLYRCEQVCGMLGTRSHRHGQIVWDA